MTYWNFTLVVFFLSLFFLSLFFSSLKHSSLSPNRWKQLTERKNIRVWCNSRHLLCNACWSIPAFDCANVHGVCLPSVMSLLYGHLVMCCEYRTVEKQCVAMKAGCGHHVPTRNSCVPTIKWAVTHRWGVAQGGRWVGKLAEWVKQTIENRHTSMQNIQWNERTVRLSCPHVASIGQILVFLDLTQILISWCINIDSSSWDPHKHGQKYQKEKKRFTNRTKDTWDNWEPSRSCLTHGP